MAPSAVADPDTDYPDTSGALPVRCPGMNYDAR